MEASRARTRLWPSGANFNRSFPGHPGGPADRAAGVLLLERAVSRSRLVIDMHSAVSVGWIVPCSHMCVPKNPAQRGRCSRRWRPGTRTSTSSTHRTETTCPNEAERQGKIVVTTELGGGTRIPVAVQDIAWKGLTNVLRHVGVLEGDVITRASLGLPPANLVDCRFRRRPRRTGRQRSLRQHSRAGHRLFEVLIEPGSPVAEGSPWFASGRGTTRRVLLLISPRQSPGYLMGLRVPAVEKGKASPSSAAGSTATPCCRSRNSATGPLRWPRRQKGFDRETRTSSLSVARSTANQSWAGSLLSRGEACESCRLPTAR